MTRDELLAAYACGERVFREANLRGADLSEADLSAANLRTAYLCGAGLSGARLRGADMSWANLRGADLSGANLSEANLSEADLSGANLRGAGLREADMREADLSGAHLSVADLREADLRAADLSGANLYEVRWGATRLHDSGTWSAAPPRCAAGCWHAWVLAPGVVRIGCTTMSVSEWLTDGAQLAEENGVEPRDVHTLREWLLRLDAQTEWPGWVPDGERGGE